MKTSSKEREAWWIIHSWIQLTQLCLMSGDTWQARWGKTHVIVQHPGSLTFICPNTWRGLQGVSWDHHTGCLFAASASWLWFSLPASSSWHSKGDGFAVVKPTSRMLVSHQPLQKMPQGFLFLVTQRQHEHTNRTRRNPCQS